MITYNFNTRVATKREKVIRTITSLVAEVLKIKDFSVNVMKHKDLYGYGEADETGIWIRNTKDTLQVIRTIAHELVHTRQMKEGKLEHIYEDYWKWEGKTDKYPLYHLQPWEQEAFHFENYFINNLPDLL